MATFEEQVEGLTGLSLGSSSNPTRDELVQFLKDGVIDVTNKSIAMDPNSAEEFLRQSAEQTSNGFNPGTTKIMAVLRESGTDGQWYPCTKSSMALEYKVTDPTSLHYASKFNPVYMISQNRNVHVYPAPSSAGNDTFKVLYVNYDPEETDGTDLAYNSTGLKWFPEDKVYLVILYASIKSLGNALAAKSKIDLSVSALPPAQPDLTDPSITLPTDVPTFVIPPSLISYTNIDTYIDTEEDIELATAKIQEMNLKLQEYQADIQKNLNSFNASNAEYQAELQKAVQDGQLKSQNDAQKIQKYSSEIQMYSAEVQKQVQEWTTSFNNFQTDYQWMQGRQAALFQEYMSAFARQASPQQERRR